MNSLQDFGRWGSNLLGEATSTGTSFASSSFNAVKSGAKKATQSVKSNYSARHTFDDPQGGTHVVSEVCHIAEGGFGMVIKVRDASGTEYALKTIGCQEGVQIASTLEAAEREATILKTLPPHAGIIRCFGSDTVSHEPGSNTVKLLLELCPGGTLLDYMDSKDGKLGAKEVVQPFAQIVDAVGHLHAQKPPIQHRDLKVENVLMGTDGHWKLCDFGSCSSEVIPPKELSRQRLMDLQESIDKTVTMLYRPPEMADIDLNFRNGYTIDTQVDIWMLGCILYTLAFYRHPFQDCPTAMAVSNGKYFIPEDHPLGKSAKLCGIIHWLLAKDPKDRPKTSRITELLGELGKCQYEDLYKQMPMAVQEKIKKLDSLFSKRKDTGDVPLPPAAAALMAASAAASGNRATATQRQPQPPPSEQQRRPAASPPPQQQRRPAASTNGATQASPSTSSSSNAGGFDLMAALAPSDARAVDSRMGVAQHKPPAAARAPVEDLLSLNSPTPAPATAASPSAGGPEFIDLFGFGTAPAVASSAANCDFADFTSAPAAPAVQGNNDWCDFSMAPAPMPQGGYCANPMPAAAPASSTSSAAISNDLVGFDFLDPLAPSPVPATAAVNAPNAQSCGGAARAAAPAPAGSFNLLDLL